MIQILKWTPINEDDPDTFPKTDSYIMLSFDNWSLPCIGRYEDGAFYEGDDDTPLITHGLFVNAWAPMIRPYREDDVSQPQGDLISRTEVIKSIDEREDVNGKVDAESVRTDIVLMQPVNSQNCDACEVGNPCLYCKHEFEERSGEE